jgi:hypothetical protein
VSGEYKKGKKMRRVSCLLFGFIVALGARAYAYDDHDFQVWNTDAEEFKIDKDSKVVMEEEFRWGNNASEFYYHHYDAGYFYNLKKWLNVGGGYRQVYQLSKGKFKAENEPYVTATLLFEKKGFAFDSRNRLEYRHFGYQDDSLRYRNKFTLKFPWKFTKLQMQPYVSDEVLIGIGPSITELNQNRLYAGFGANLTKNLKAELYYMLLSSKSSGIWNDANVLGTKFKISF